MHSKPIRLLALVATVLVVASGVHALLRGPAPREAGPPKRPTGIVSNDPPGKRKIPLSALPCRIKRATFGGTHASLLRLMKGRFPHYIVMDNPPGNPLIQFYQRDWLEANYGDVQPAVLGEFATVEEAIANAATLCRRN